MKRLIIRISLALNLLFVLICFTPLVENLYKPLIVNEVLHGEKQAIVVLSAGMYNEDLPDFRTTVRVKKGYDLYRQGIAGDIICIGGVRVGSAGKSIAALMRESFILLGVAPENIFTEDETLGTYHDITYTMNKFGKVLDFNKAVFVTSSYHTRRVKAILLAKGLTAQVVSAEPYELQPERWSERPDFFREVMREYLALCYSKLAGWI